jgi:DNA-binding CsgD family transcriptional regulator
MSIDQRVLDIVDALYTAAMDESLWPSALQRLSDLTGSQAASFWVLDGSAQPRLPTFTYINFDPRFIQEYIEHMTPMDPTVQYLVKHPLQSIVHDGLVISERDKERHPYYDWHQRSSDTRFRLVNQICPAPSVQAGVALHRTRKAGRYEAADIEQFTFLHRHIERALTMAFKLGTLGTLQRCSAELLDRNPVAVILLDAHRTVVYRNRAADQLNADGVRIHKGGISLTRRQDNDRLQRLITEALAVDELVRTGNSVMRAARPSAKPPYSILVTPMSRSYPALTALRPAVCVAIADPTLQQPLATQRLRSLFELTEAEARLAVLLASGEGVREAAATLQISYGTARVRLAEIFRKTDTHRQGELVRLLATILTLS